MRAVTARGSVFDPKYTGVPQADPYAIPAEGVDHYAVKVLTIGMVLCAATQKIALPFAGSFLQITLLIVWGLMGWLFYHGRLVISTTRAALYVLTFGTGFIAASLSPSPGAGSFLLTCASATPFLAVMQTNRATQRAFLANFQKLALVGVGLVFIDHLCQVVGPGMPNLERVVPDFLLFGGFNYSQPIVWRSALEKPNALFFLEASAISQFLACAMVFELAIFRRMKMIVALGAGMMAVFAGTGFVLVLACLPVYIGKWLKPRTVLIALLTLGVLAGVAATTGWVDMMTARTKEFGEKGQSGNARFVAPFQAVWVQLTQAPLAEALVGFGPGSQERDAQDIMLVTPAKIVLDYGGVVLLFYTIFVLVSLFGGGGYPAACFATFVLIYILNSAPAQPFLNAYAFLFTTVYAIRPTSGGISYRGLESLNAGGEIVGPLHSSPVFK